MTSSGRQNTAPASVFITDHRNISLVKERVKTRLSFARAAMRVEHVGSREIDAALQGDGAIVFSPCKLGREGIVSKRLGSIYRRGRSPLWVKVKNPNARAVKRDEEEDWPR